MSIVLDWDASEIAIKIKRGVISSQEVTNTYIEHLQKANESVNCMTANRFEEARREAAAADAKLKSGEVTGALHGVPISIKDCFHVEGMATTAGLSYRANLQETSDAEAVRRLKQEGAIIIAKTNTPALCFCQETDNKLHGRTNNPWKLDRTAGGSSGGEGALMAIGGAAVGLGADIGGSIRFPSHFNGVVGFKSGNKQVSAVGNYPNVTIPEQERMLGIGGMGKSVRDARLINEIVTGKKRVFANLDDYEIVIPGKQASLPLSTETDGILGNLAARLREEFKVSEALPPYFNEASLLWQEIMSIDGAKHVKEIMSADGRAKPIVEYVKEKLIGKSDFHSYLTWALIGANMFKPSKARLQEIKAYLTQGDIELESYFAKRVLLLPVYHTTAQKHGTVYREIFSIRKTYLKYMPYIAYANVWGLPALTLPMGTDAEGMPIGVQLVSSIGNEDALFQLGEWLEENVYRYRRCTAYDG